MFRGDQNDSDSATVPWNSLRHWAHTSSLTWKKSHKKHLPWMSLHQRDNRRLHRLKVYPGPGHLGCKMANEKPGLGGGGGWGRQSIAGEDGPDCRPGLRIISMLEFCAAGLYWRLNRPKSFYRLIMTDYENGSEEELSSANEAYLGSTTFLNTKRHTKLNVKRQHN